jgi:hypothetical protein
LAKHVKPGRLTLLDLFGQALRRFGCTDSRMSEPRRPQADIPISVGGQAADVGLWFCGKQTL